MSAHWLVLGGGGGNESFCSFHAGCWLLGNGSGSWKAVVTRWLTPLFAEFLCMLQLTHQWKATFFPLSGAWLCRRAKGRWENDGQYSNPALARLTMWGLCALVDQQTERPFSWSNRFTNPTPAFLCTLIMQQTHAYSRANHVTSAGTPCKVIKIVKEHVIQVDQYIERT